MNNGYPNKSQIYDIERKYHDNIDMIKDEINTYSSTKYIKQTNE